MIDRSRRSTAPKASWAHRWLFEPVPLGRVAAFRIAVYTFVWLDVLLIRPWVVNHGRVPGDLYQPLFLGRLLALPVPTPSVALAVKLTLLLAAGIALTGRWPRASGLVVFALYLQWMFIAFSYGKVDHDRIAFLVALAVLPTVGRARPGDRTESDSAGWALHLVQLAVVATYLLAAMAKLRYGGLEWVTGATLTRAVLRRGTFLADPLLDYPLLLRAGQYGIMVFELLSPLLLTRKVGRLMLVLAVVFHLVTYAAITIIFHPHILCLLAFLPLERIEVPARLTSLFPQPARPPPAPG